MWHVDTRVCVCVLNCFSRVRLCATLWTAAHQAPLPMGFSRQEYWGGYHFLLQGIFLVWGSNPSLLSLLHWQVGSLPLVPPGKPLYWYNGILFSNEKEKVLTHTTTTTSLESTMLKERDQARKPHTAWLHEMPRKGKYIETASVGLAKTSYEKVKVTQ